MGYIKRNGINYFGDNSVSLTQAQYDALVQAGEVDPNATYYIVDAGSVLSVDLIYPIGSIFMSVNNVNPGTYLTNTTWVAWGAGRVPIGVDTTDTDFDTAEETGGNKSNAYTPAGSNTGGAVADHTLAPKELPQRIIVQARNATSAARGASAVNATWTSISVAANATAVTSNYDAGNNGLVVWNESTPDVGGKAHNHDFTQPTFTGTEANISTVQPYITCYMWKRVS